MIKEDELSNTLETLGKKPKLVITDSQVFARVSEETPEDIWLTSFSILFARFKGNLKTAAAGAAALDRLKDGDKILISEGCTHHRQCDDIGTVKLPRWIRNYTGKELEFEYSSGRDFPEDVTKYSLIVHCGGCMLNEREMRYRQKCALDQEIPITNYGIAIAYMQGILKRCVEMFPDVRKELEQVNFFQVFTFFPKNDIVAIVHFINLQKVTIRSCRYNDRSDTFTGPAERNSNTYSSDPKSLCRNSIKNFILTEQRSL